MESNKDHYKDTNEDQDSLIEENRALVNTNAKNQSEDALIKTQKS